MELSDESESEAESIYGFVTDSNDAIDSRYQAHKHHGLQELVKWIDGRLNSAFMIDAIVEVIEKYYTYLRPGPLRDFLDQHLEDINGGHYLYCWSKEACSWFWLPAYRAEYIFTKSTKKLNDVWTTSLWVFISRGPAAESQGKSPVILRIMPKFFRGGATTKIMHFLVNGAKTPGCLLHYMASAFPWYNGIRRLCVRPGFWDGSDLVSPTLHPEFAETNMNFSWALLLRLLLSISSLC